LKQAIEETTEEAKAAVAHAATVCATFNSAGLFIANMSKRDKRLMLEVWGTTISRCYSLCLPLILERRHSIHELFWKQFEELNDSVPEKVKWKPESPKVGISET
jgi:hypothetical protein